MKTIGEAKICQVILEVLNVPEGVPIINYHKLSEENRTTPKKISELILFLISLGLVQYSSIEIGSFEITDKGREVAKLNILNYWMRSGEKEKKKIDADDLQLDKVFIDYSNALNQKYGYPISIIISLISLVIASISLYVTLHKH